MIAAASVHVSELCKADSEVVGIAEQVCRVACVLAFLGCIYLDEAGRVWIYIGWVGSMPLYFLCQYR